MPGCLNFLFNFSPQECFEILRLGFPVLEGSHQCMTKKLGRWDLCNTLSLLSFFFVSPFAFQFLISALV